ncbi:MAG: hypothetical protein GJ680_05005 [Alteromonadaceae bacterium]|nr:hypothetical protein [Alteromonadaceae bacterium]
MNRDDSPISVLLIKAYAHKFKANRKQLGLTQEAMVELIQRTHSTVTDRTVKRWEKGETAVPAWALGLQEELLEHFKDYKNKKHLKSAILEQTSSGFFYSLKKKLKSN